MIVLRRSSGFTWIPRTTSSISLIFFPLDNFDRNVNTSSNLLRLLEELVEKAENKSCWEVSKLAGMMIKASTSWLGMSWNRTLFSAIRSDMIIPWHTSQLLPTVLNVEMIALSHMFVWNYFILIQNYQIKKINCWSCRYVTTTTNKTKTIDNATSILLLICTSCILFCIVFRSCSISGSKIVSRKDLVK